MDARGDLLPHRPPWLLVDRVVSRDEGRVECEKRLTATDPLLHAGETLRLVAVKEAALGALIRFAGSAFVGERAIASGQMTFAVEAAA